MDPKINKEYQTFWANQGNATESYKQEDSSYQILNRLVKYDDSGQVATPIGLLIVQFNCHN